MLRWKQIFNLLPIFPLLLDLLNLRCIPHKPTKKPMPQLQRVGLSFLLYWCSSWTCCCGRRGNAIIPTPRSMLFWNTCTRMCAIQRTDAHDANVLITRPSPALLSNYPILETSCYHFRFSQTTAEDAAELVRILEVNSSSSSELSSER